MGGCIHLNSVRGVQHPGWADIFHNKGNHGRWYTRTDTQELYHKKRVSQRVEGGTITWENYSSGGLLFMLAARLFRNENVVLHDALCRFRDH